VFRKPLVWFVLVLVAAACSVYCLTYFPRAFPLVNLDLRMDRDAAMDEASRLATEHSWGPEGFRKAAAFQVDDEVRSFVELEAGGRKAYIEMMGGDLYSPYTWEVRLFLPGEASETRVRFTPAGEFFGFECRKECLVADDLLQLLHQEPSLDTRHGCVVVVEKSFAQLGNRLFEFRQRGVGDQLEH